MVISKRQNSLFAHYGEIVVSFKKASYAEKMDLIEDESWSLNKTNIYYRVY